MTVTVSNSSWRLPNQLSVREVVTDRVRRAILEQEVPPGTRLRQTQLADALGVSRMPVRDAIQELVAEGLLDTLPGGGVRVPAFDLQEILGALALRGPLEQEAIRAIAARCEDLARPVPVSVPSGLDFHRSLAAAAGNRFLTTALTPIWAQVERLAHVHPGVADCGERGADHAAIVRCLANGDGEAASRMLRGHLDVLHVEVAEWGRAQQRLAS